ncbi:MAG TPA: hypothetical protein DCX46_12090 [Bacteroidetes bacterium]|nr:hypothetical protein [Bacteroidota bacterium]
MMSNFIKQRTTPWVPLILFMVCLCYLPSDLWSAAQGKIAGKVIDSESKQPLVGVNVVILGTTMGAATDTQGEYFVANVPPGAYSVKASMVGYQEVTVTDVRVHVDRTTELHFELRERALVVSEGIVVTARRQLVEKDNTASRLIVESSELKLRPTTEFTRILTSLPGIDVENGEMRVRGGSLDQVAFMIDGARSRNPLDQSPYTSINLSSIQEMEVITGSFNAEYGEAQSGVINIITKEGEAKYHFYVDQRFTPAGKKHWGPGLYDRGTDLYWENTHSRHLQWWIDHPDQWVDPNGLYGNDPRTSWTPEQAYENYLTTHRPLTDYANIPSYQTEISIGGRVPSLEEATFFLTGKYASVAPLFGNSYRSRGEYFNGTLKISYNLNPSMRLQFSGFYGTEKTSWGIFQEPDYFYATTFGYRGRYAYYDLPGLPESRTDNQTLRFVNILDATTMLEVRLSRVNAHRKTDAFPDDPNGWQGASGVTLTDNIRARDATGRRIDFEQGNPLGFNTTGYFARNNDSNTDWTLTGYYTSQMNKNWQLKTGMEFTYYDLKHFNESKSIQAKDDRTYNPYQGALYLQSKFEFGGLILNAGLRFDFYNPNDSVYVNPFNPFNSPSEKTKLFSQLSPRLGIAHPIDDRTVLHFSYGHFFQRGRFADYGEGLSEESALGNLTTLVDSSRSPLVLGNREMKPQKTVAFEIGIERNFADIFVLDVTGCYKDITNTIRTMQVIDRENDISYTTNGNGDYADVRGIEVSLRKLPSHYLSGYVNFSTKLGVFGRSGDPKKIFPDRVDYGPSGDVIAHNNPRLKAAVYFQTPKDAGLVGGALDDILISLEYVGVFPNRNLRQDVFRYSDSSFTAAKLRRVDERVDFKVSKGFSFMRNKLNFTLFCEVTNLLNEKWINFSAVERASLADQKVFAQSDFETLPTRDVNGVPLLDIAKYRNLPRSILFGLTMELPEF